MRGGREPHRATANQRIGFSYWALFRHAAVVGRPAQPDIVQNSRQVSKCPPVLARTWKFSDGQVLRLPAPRQERLHWPAQIQSGMSRGSVRRRCHPGR
jgi:hypothetical protein